MKKRIYLRAALCCIITAAAVLTGCGRAVTGKNGEVPGAASLTPVPVQDGYRTTYEVFVYSFYDSDGDGTGDLPGGLEALDYINDGDPDTKEDLGCDQIWLMPVCPSPTYHKYDVADYCAIDPDYGTLEDFDALISACHGRGVRVIIDLVLNHTSVEHPWFQKAAAYLRELPPDWGPSAEYCPEFAYYHFSREQQSGYAPLEGSNWYYEAQFWEGMPDLNLSEEAVRKEIAAVTQFWLDRGVDGFRLDALTSYYTGDRNASIDFLTWLTQTVKAQSPEAVLVGEAWTSQGDYAEYYRSGIDSLFDFAFAGQDGVIASVVRGSRKAGDYAEEMAKEEELYASKNPAYINAPFYTNHDMARSTGYYAYDDGSRTKLAGALNLLMPGNAFLYYGEELGMKGSGKDENKRAPMYWTQSGPGQDGNCRGPEAMDSISMKFGSLEEQKEDPLSVWNYYRDALRLRTSLPAVARGRTQPIETGQDRLCAFLRTMEEAEAQKWQDTPAQLLILINTGDQTLEVKLPDLGISGAEPLCALTVAEDKVVYKDKMVSLPPFGVAVLAPDR